MDRCTQSNISLKECIQYKKQRELSIRHFIGTSLGQTQENEINILEFFKTIKILNFIEVITNNIVI